MKKSFLFYLILFIIITFIISSFFNYNEYKNVKGVYNTRISGIVINKDRGRNRLFFQLNNQNEKVYLYCRDEESIQIGDSIFKNINSEKVYIYYKSNNRYFYSHTISFNKELNFYNYFINTAPERFPSHGN
jgi:hypothetical protein